MDHWVGGYLNAWSPPSSTSQSPVSAPFLIEHASDYTFPPTETTSPHQPHKIMTKQPTVKARLPSFQHHCIGGLGAEGTFVQDEIESGWSPKTSSALVYLSSPTCNIRGACSFQWDQGSRKLCSLKPYHQSRDGKRVWEKVAYCFLTKSLTNNTSS